MLPGPGREGHGAEQSFGHGGSAKWPVNKEKGHFSGYFSATELHDWQEGMSCMGWSWWASAEVWLHLCSALQEPENFSAILLPSSQEKFPLPPRAQRLGFGRSIDMQASDTAW